jgi:hypothetical protein
VRTVKAALGGAPHVLVGLSLGGKVALDVVRRMQAELEEHCRGGGGGSGGSGSGSVAGGGGSGGGGGAAAEAAEAAPPPHRALPLHCWVLDSQPGTVPPEADGPTSVAKILSFIARTPMPVASRQALTDALDAEGLPRAVSWWLASGLVPDAPPPAAAPRAPAPASASGSSPLRWEFDSAGAAALYHSYRLSSYWDVLERPPPGTTLHVVRGERSDRWSPDMLARLEAARAAWQAAEVHEGPAVGALKLHVLRDAGHWLQVCARAPAWRGGWTVAGEGAGGGCAHHGRHPRPRPTLWRAHPWPTPPPTPARPTTPRACRT